MRWIRRIAVAVIVLGAASLAVGAMARSDDRPTASAEFAPVSGHVAQLPRAIPVTPAGAGRAVFTRQRAVEVGFGDRVIRTAEVQVEVEEGRFDAAWDAAYQIAGRFGGEVIGASRGDNASTRSGDRVMSGSIAIRVPGDELDATVRELSSSLGELRSQQTSSEDVSQEYVDLRSQLRNLRAERAALLDLFARSTSVRDTLAVQTRLSKVQGEIERITGRINFIESRTDFATITLTIAEPGAGVLLLTTEDGPSFAGAWDTAVDGLIRIATTAMITAIWLAPFVLIAAVVIGMWRRTRPSPQA